MPSVSKKQRAAAGIAMAIKKGKMQPQAGTASAQMAAMPAGTLGEFAGTPEAGLPVKKVSKAVIKKSFKKK